MASSHAVARAELLDRLQLLEVRGQSADWGGAELAGPLGSGVMCMPVREQQMICMYESWGSCKGL